MGTHSTLNLEFPYMGKCQVLPFMGKNQLKCGREERLDQCWT